MTEGLAFLFLSLLVVAKPKANPSFWDQLVLEK